MTSPTPRVECLVFDVATLRVERDALEATLGPEEHAHAARFRSAGDRERFLLRRGALRRLLAARERRDPRSLRWRTGASGKPALVDSDLRFSASSSGDVVAVAIARGLEVGLDVERLRALPGVEAVGEPFLSSRDRARLGALPRSIRAEALLRLFTLREAVAKREGSGIGGGLGGLELPLDALRFDGAYTVPTAGGGAIHLVARTLGASAVLALAVAEAVEVGWDLGRRSPTPDQGPVVVPAGAG